MNTENRIKYIGHVYNDKTKEGTISIIIDDIKYPISFKIHGIHDDRDFDLIFPEDWFYTNKDNDNCIQIPHLKNINNNDGDELLSDVGSLLCSIIREHLEKEFPNKYKDPKQYH